MLYIWSRQNQIPVSAEACNQDINTQSVYIIIETPHFQTKNKEKEKYALCEELNLLSTCPQTIPLR